MQTHVLGDLGFNSIQGYNCVNMRDSDIKSHLNEMPMNITLITY